MKLDFHPLLQQLNPESYLVYEKIMGNLLPKVFKKPLEDITLEEYHKEWNHVGGNYWVFINDMITYPKPITEIAFETATALRKIHNEWLENENNLPQEKATKNDLD